MESKKMDFKTFVKKLLEIIGPKHDDRLVAFIIGFRSVEYAYGVPKSVRSKCERIMYNFYNNRLWRLKPEEIRIIKNGGWEPEEIKEMVGTMHEIEVFKFIHPELKFREPEDPPKNFDKLFLYFKLGNGSKKLALKIIQHIVCKSMSKIWYTLTKNLVETMIEESYLHNVSKDSAREFIDNIIYEQGLKNPIRNYD